MNSAPTITDRITSIKNLLNCGDVKSLIDEFNNSKNNSSHINDYKYILNKEELNFVNIINKLNGKLTYIKSGTTGHTFKGISNIDNKQIEYAIKVVPFPKKNFGTRDDIQRPENAELNIIKLLSYFVINSYTPHIILPITTFDTDIELFAKLVDNGYISEQNNKYLEFIKKYKKNKYYSKVSILISEWANGGDLLEYIRNNHNTMNLLEWKVIIFQILSVLAIIHFKYPSFKHNDLKANNIMVHHINLNKKIITYTINNITYKIPNIGIQIKITDFDFSCISNIVKNNKVESDWASNININSQQNQYYDIHYFFNTLIHFIPTVMSSPNVPNEIKIFINDVVPLKYQTCNTPFIHEKGRLLIQDEYTTPAKLLATNILFNTFKQSNSQINSTKLSSIHNIKSESISNSQTIHINPSITNTQINNTNKINNNKQQTINNNKQITNNNEFNIMKFMSPNNTEANLLKLIKNNNCNLNNKQKKIELATFESHQSYLNCL